MAHKLYVGNLPFATSEEGLRELFTAYGEVESAKIIMDNIKNRSKGFGFVEMETKEDADSAIEELNGKDYEGRTLRIDHAKPKKPRAPRPMA